MKKCFKCGIEKELTEFYKHPRMADGTVNKCKECNKKDVRENREDKKDYYNEFDRNRSNKAERAKKCNDRVRTLYHEDDDFRENKLKVVREWYQNNKEVVLSQKKRWADNNPDKRSAQHAVGNAIRDGILVRPKECEHCLSTERKIQGHHWSYLEENWLEVMWLCTKCHAAEHKRLRDLNQDPDKLIKMENVT